MGVVNKTLQELNAFDKPTVVIFNKMDLYIKNTFDEWLDETTKEEILNDLKLNNKSKFVNQAER